MHNHHTSKEKKHPRRLPYEFPADEERYTEEVVAIDRIELVSSGDVALDDPAPGINYSPRVAKRTSDYHEGNKAAPDNNLFFEERSNPLSSKGN